MYSHAPPGYRCPFCEFLGGNEGATWNRRADVVAGRPDATALVSPEQWPNNPGHVLVIPNRHYENIYDLPLTVATSIHELSRDVALAMKSAFECEGTSTRQHNEPAGNQEVWHYHQHVFPRYQGDQLYRSPKSRIPEPERAQQASRLREAFGKAKPRVG